MYFFFIHEKIYFILLLDNVLNMTFKGFHVLYPLQTSKNCYVDFMEFWSVSLDLKITPNL